ncbi:MAG TPA: hypothetical protein VGL91_16265 [Acidobacteriota bacterium]|jgi:hypothetical protein
MNLPNFHGFTVVIYTDGPMTYVGRWDQQIGEQILLNDACVHCEGDDGMTRDEFVLRIAKFGPRATHKRFVVPAGVVTRVRTLGEVSKELLGI